MTTGGITGTAVFQWKKDGGAYTTGVTTTAVAQALRDGVQIYWPTGVTYVLGDTFIINATAVDQSGVPRFELWPHKKSAYVYPYFYESDPPDLEDPGATIPRYIRGDVLLEEALAKAAAWPGTEGKPNPYYDVRLASWHHTAAEKMTQELEVSDDGIYMQDLSYVQAMQMAPVPWGDSAWLQKHESFY
jgi:hypothetical protein